LLAQIGVTPDRVIAPDIDETPSRGELPRDFVRRIARAKAASVMVPDHAILAADTVVAAGRRILGKAETAEEARISLALLSGRRHRVMTALVLRGPDGRQAERLTTSIVAFARLTDLQLAAYLEAGEWRGKAGAYAVQGRAAVFVRFLSGSYSNVVGLPLFETAQLLRALGWSLP
jgi:septum formation protein